MSERWPRVRLGEVLRRRDPDVSVDATASYQFAGVYSFGRGVFRSQQRVGSEFSYKVLTQLSEGDFVYPKLMAWEGAFGIVPADCGGCYVSPEFPVFSIDVDRLLPAFLGFYFRLPRVWDEISGGSIGTNVRRRRLNPAAFEDFEICLPPVEEQQRIVARIEELGAKVAEAQALRRDAVKQGQALLRSILARDADCVPTPMHDLVRPRQPDVTVQPEGEYQFAGVYSFGRGVFVGQRRMGAEFAYPRLTTLRAGDFVYPKLMAWEGAFGIVPVECDGCVVSTEFPVFEVDSSKVLPEVLDVHFKQPTIWPEISGASTGTNVRRRRLNPKEFLHYSLPLPTWETQLRLRETAGRINALIPTQTESSANLDALLPSILDRAFKGDL